MADLPEKLFKYVGPDRIDVLQRLYIRFTPPARFNDPFELMPSVKALDDPKEIDAQEDTILRRIYRTYVIHCKSENRKPFPYDQFAAIQIPHHRKTMAPLKQPEVFREAAMVWNQRQWGVIGILSLSATEKNLLMWAHYTSAHEGFVIEFDPHAPFFQAPEKTAGLDFGVITKVVYSKTRLSIEFGEPNPEILTTKSDEWAYEQEWRVFQHVKDCDKSIKLENDTIHLFKLPPKSLKRVIIGIRMPQQKRDDLISAISENSDLKHVQIDEVTLDLDNFDFNYIPLVHR